MLKFCAKVFKILISKSLHGFIISGMIIDIGPKDIGPKFYSALSPPFYLQVKATDLEILC